MKNYNYLYCFIIGAAIGIMLTIWYDARVKREETLATQDEKEEELASVVWRQNHFFLSDENLHNELIAQGVDYPEIVLAQAQLETGHYKSNACVSKNNLFGLRNYNGSYMHFDHWTDAVAAYKKFIQKYEQPPDDYYKYLQDLGYAEDPEYINKLKKLVK